MNQLYELAYNERWPTAEQVEREWYRPLTFQERQRLREARSEATRRRINAENEARKTVCACVVCTGLEHGVHGEALYNHKQCRCVVCRKAHAAGQRDRRRFRDEHGAVA